MLSGVSDFTASFLGFSTAISDMCQSFDVEQCFLSTLPV